MRTFFDEIIDEMLKNVVHDGEVVLLDTSEKAQEFGGKLGDHVQVWKPKKFEVRELYGALT